MAALLLLPFVAGYAVYGGAVGWLDGAKDILERVIIVVVSVLVALVAISFFVARSGGYGPGGVVTSAVGSLERVVLGLFAFLGALVEPVARLARKVL